MQKDKKNEKLEKHVWKGEREREREREKNKNQRRRHNRFGIFFTGVCVCSHHVFTVKERKKMKTLITIFLVWCCTWDARERSKKKNLRLKRRRRFLLGFPPMIIWLSEQKLLWICANVSFAFPTRHFLYFLYFFPSLSLSLSPRITISAMKLKLRKTEYFFLILHFFWKKEAFQNENSDRQS